ncbi:von Willebrand factor type A domain-containing protein [Hyaloraphidium curvatum]|nr:von Willebrand factor type A domain-containing protein [Hyaloraphidium curvatum]
MTNLSTLTAQFGLIVIGCPLPEPPRELPKAVPLKTVQLSGTITHPNIADLKLAQHYVNANSFPLTALYKCPLEEGAAVCGFEAEVVEVDGKKHSVRGTVKERKKAAAEYKEAVGKGQGAYLVESEKDDVFQISVGNIPAKASVTVTLSLLAALPADLSSPDSVRFMLPTTIGSATYGESVLKEGSNMIAGTPPTQESTGVELSVDLSVRVPAGSAVEAIETHSHPLSVSTEVSSDPAFAVTKVQLANPSSRLNKDFVLVLRLPHADRPRCLFQYDPATASFVAALSMVPRFPLPSTTTPKELVFVVDRSGSMQGTSIAHAKEALKLMLRSLPADEGVRFNIVSFGSSFKSLWPESKPYDERSMKEAEAEVDRMDADMGGTELLAPIQAILNGTLGSHAPRNNALPKLAKAQAGLSRSIVLLTDGEIWNTQDLLRLVHSHAQSSNVRLFALGIGPAVSTHLVKGIARCGNGIAEFVGEGERMEKKVVKMVKLSLVEGVRNVKIDFGLIDPDPENMDVDPKPAVGTKSEPVKPAGKLSFFSEDLTEDTTPFTSAGSESVPRVSFQQAPHIVPPLYPSSRYTVYAFLRAPGLVGGQPPKSIKITGVGPAGDMELDVPVTVLPPAYDAKEGTAPAGSDRALHVLAAKRLIQDLGDGASYLHDAVTAEVADGVAADAVAKEIVRLGTTFQLASTETSWIAIDPDTKVEVAQAQQVIVPQERESGRPAMGGFRGRGGGGGMFRAMPMMACAAMPAPMMMKARSAAPSPAPARASSMGFAAPGARFGGFVGGAAMDSMAAFDASEPFLEQERGAPSSKEKSRERSSSGASDSRSVFTWLVASQGFDGSWPDASVVASICGFSRPATPTGVDEKVWATVLAVSFLELKLASLHDEFELLVEKAKRWVGGKASTDLWAQARKAVA